MNFLIRTKENRITGPLSKEAVIARMQSGELREMDEVCPANGYWIYFHERDESIKLLGVALARSDSFHEDSTETDTETVTATQPSVISQATLKAPELRNPPPSASRPEPVRGWILALWLIVVVIGFILLRVYQVANPL